MHLAFSEDKKDQGWIAVERNGVKHSDSLQTKGEGKGFLAPLFQLLKVFPGRKKENQSSLVSDPIDLKAKPGLRPTKRVSATAIKTTIPKPGTVIRALYFLKLSAITASLCALAACGGGGGGSSSSPSSPSPTGATLSGTAATGIPIVGGAVSLKDSVGSTATTTTDSNGNYSFGVNVNSFPVMLKVQPNIPGAVPLFSAALTSGTANTTPFTTLQVFEAVGGTDPSEIYNSGDFSRIRNSTLNYGKITVISNLASQLASNGLNPANINPITTPMVANGIGMDAIMDHTSAAIIGNNASLIDSTGNPIPLAAPNEMTLTVDGMDKSNISAFIGIPINAIPFFGSNLSKDFGTKAGYVKGYLIKAGIPGIDKPRPNAPNITNPHIMLSCAGSA